MKTADLRHWLRLLTTASPREEGLKLLRAPDYRGGPRTKSAQLADLLAGDNAPYHAAIALSAVRVPVTLLRLLRWRGVKIVVNQNGVYYPAWAGESFRARNRYLARLNGLAHHTFFQSAFARESYREWVGPEPASASILHNAVDLARFSPKPRESGEPVTLLFFYDYKEQTRIYWEHLFAWTESPGFPLREFRIIGVGNCAGSDQKVLAELKARASRGSVELHANLGGAELPAALARADVYPHLIYNDVCPNKVLEAMACGVWTMGVSAGGTAELIGEAGAVLEVPGGYGPPVLPSHEAMSEALRSFLKAPNERRATARRRAEHFGLDSWRTQILRACGINRA